MMKLQLTLKYCFDTNENLLKLLYIENDFGKSFAECYNLFKCFISHITVIPQRIQFYTMGKIKFTFTKYFSGTRVNPAVSKC